jgi:hypothetical protein
MTMTMRTAPRRDFRISMRQRNGAFPLSERPAGSFDAGALAERDRYCTFVGMFRRFLPHLVWLVAVQLLACGPEADVTGMDGEEFRALDSALVPGTTYVQGDSALATGWYFVVDSGYGFLRRCQGEMLFVDPGPIVTAGNIIDLDIGPDLSGRDMLKMRLDLAGAKRFWVATGKYVNKRLAFVIRNVAVSAPLIGGDIPNGNTGFIPGRGSSTTAEQFGELVREDMARVPAIH